MADRPALWKVFEAGRVHRWHTHPHMGGSGDTLDGHSARVARIILALHRSPSAALLTAALTHDDGEYGLADIPWPAYRNLPKRVAADLSNIEQRLIRRLWNGSDVQHLLSGLSDLDKAWLKFADRLDGYMWVAHHRPDLLKDDEWAQARANLHTDASRLGVKGLPI